MSSPKPTVRAKRKTATRDRSLSRYPAVPPEWVHVTTPHQVRFVWERAVQQSDLHPSARGVVMHIASKIFKGEASASIGLSKLASMAGLDKSTVARIVTYLERHGFVYRQGGGRRVATVYWPMLPVALAETLAGSAEYASDRPKFEALLTEAALPPGAGSRAPDGSERPKRARTVTEPARLASRRPAELVPAQETRSAKPLKDDSAVTFPTDDPPPTSGSDGEIWIQAVFDLACRWLEHGYADREVGRAEASALRLAYEGLRSRKQLDRRLLGLMSRNDGFHRTAKLLESHRWRGTTPGALAWNVEQAWENAGRPRGVPVGVPLGYRPSTPLPMDELVAQALYKVDGRRGFSTACPGVPA